MSSTPIDYDPEDWLSEDDFPTPWSTDVERLRLEKYAEYQRALAEGDAAKAKELEEWLESEAILEKWENS